MKKSCFVLTAMFVFTVLSCQKSQFSTATRNYKNGKASYTNHYLSEKSIFSDIKFHKSRNKKTDNQGNTTASFIPETNSAPEPGVTKINPVPITDSINLIASNSKVPTIFGINENQVLSVNKKMISFGNHYQPQTGNLHSEAINNKESKTEMAEATAHCRGKIEPYGIVGFGIGLLGCLLVIGLLFPNVAALWMFFTGLLTGVLAIIFGSVSLGRFLRYPGHYRGKGFAIASLLMGISAIVTGIIILVVAVSSI